MAKYTIKVNGLSELNMYFNNIKAKTPEQLDILGKRLTDRMVAIAKEKVSPLNSGTGALRRSIYNQKVGNNWIVTAGEGLKRPYAYYQEFGFAPHYIHKSQFGQKAIGEFQYVEQFFPFMAPAFRRVISHINTDLNLTTEKIIRG